MYVTFWSKEQLRNLTYGALCLALCMVLPFLTGQIPEVGGMLCPMHIPVLLAGFLCTPFWGGLVGVIAPLLRFALFGMPPLFPTGAAMCVELMIYGVVCGFLYRHLPKNTFNIYVSLAAAMLLGRVGWGAAMTVIAGVTEVAFSWSLFAAGAVLNAIPGIILHIVLIPVIVMALRRAGLANL